MRTTIDLPDDLHRTALELSRERNETLSRTVAGLMRTALAGGGGAGVEVDQGTGLPTVSVGAAISAEDVEAADGD